MVDVVGIGALMLDVTLAVDQLPAWEYDVRASRSLLAAGGSTPNVLAGLSRLGRSTRLYSTIGADAAGDLAVGLHGARDVTGVRRVAGASTGVVVILSERVGGSRSLVWQPPPDVAPKVSRTAIREARAVHLNGRYPELAARVACWARADGVLVSVNVGAGTLAEGTDALLGQADVIVASGVSVCGGTGAADARAAAATLARPGGRHVAVTNGEGGSWCAGPDGRVFHQPTFPTAVIDTTGAGDAFHAAFLDAVLAAQPVEEAARRASLAGALACTAFGARGSLPDSIALSRSRIP